MTNVDPTKVTADAVDDLLPTGWELDKATGDLKAPPGAPLAFKTIDKSAAANNDTSLPPLPDLSKTWHQVGAPTILAAFWQGWIKHLTLLPSRSLQV